MNINEALISKYVFKKRLNCPHNFLRIEKKILSQILSYLCSSSAMNNTQIWEEVASFYSQKNIQSDLMLVIGISKLMKGEIAGLLWLRSNFRKYPTAKNFHAYLIALCQLSVDKKKTKLLIKSVCSFAAKKYPDYLGFIKLDFLTESFSVLPYKGNSFFITLENTFRNVCTRDIFLNECWSLESEIKWVEDTLSKTDVFIDIGANAGIYSLLAAKLVGRKGQVYAFEPNRTCIKFIKNSIRLNRLTNISLINNAVSNKKGRKEFVLYAASDHNHLKTLNETKLIRKSTVIGREKIEVTTLDSYFADKNLNKITLIKIDVEGYEKFVLEGAKKTLKQYKPKLILEINERVFSPNGYNSLELVELLKSMNYSIFRLYDNQLVDFDKKELKNNKSFNIIAMPTN